MTALLLDIIIRENVILGQGQGCVNSKLGFIKANICWIYIFSSSFVKISWFIFLYSDDFCLTIKR